MEYAPPAYPPLEATDTGVFKAVVLYEDYSTGIRGKQIADFVVAELGYPAEPELVVWNTNLFQEPGLNRVMTEQSEGADLIILSLKDGLGFTIALRAFVNGWLEDHRASQSALIAVFENGGPATDFARRHLESAARRARLEFLTQTVDLVAENDQECAELFWIM
jgi:hypothetical protein